MKTKVTIFVSLNFSSLNYPENEHIVGVACLFQTPEELLSDVWNGKPVYPFWIMVSLPAPYRHAHVMHPTNIMAGRHVTEQQGFLTSKGRFVPRDEAWKIAEVQGQIKQTTGSKGTLFSEDMW